MLQAVGASDWGAFVPGGFPTNVSNVKAASNTTVTMTMNKAYNPTWFTYNELSQITPMPQAWDVTASGPSKLHRQGQPTAPRCTPTWTASRRTCRTGCPRRSGASWTARGSCPPSTPTATRRSCRILLLRSPKPRLAKFQEAPFTTEAAEYNVLQAASAGGGQKLDVGYLPTTDAPAKPANATVGTNPVRNFTLDPLYAWGINYFPVNYQSTTGNGPIIKQLYFRAGARLPDEPAVDHQAARCAATA